MQQYLYAIVTGFALGVLGRSLYDTGITFAALLTVVAVALALYQYVHKRTHALTILFIIALIGGSLGIVRMDTAIPYTVEESSLPQEIEFEGRVVSPPEERQTYTHIVVESGELAHRTLVRAPLFLSVQYGDVVHVRGVLEPIENFRGESERLFNYQGYLAKDDIHYIMSYPHVEHLSTHPNWYTHLLALKRNYIHALERVIPEPSAALAGGITVGERRSLGDELTEAFRDTGLIHIVVLSGYNIAIIILFVSALLSFIPERPRFVCVIAAIVLFTLLVGASATVVRAAIMGSIAALGTLTHRTYSALHALILAAVVMVIWNPYLLVYDPSFQLSVIATAGLLLGLPYVSRYLTWVPEAYGLRDIVGATLSTYVAVLPLLAYMIGEVSVVAVLVNLLALPFIPIAMLFVFITGVVGMVSTAVALPFATLAHGLLHYTITIVEVFAQLPFVTVRIPVFPFWVVMMLYTLMIFVVARVYKKAAH